MADSPTPYSVALPWPKADWISLCPSPSLLSDESLTPRCCSLTPSPLLPSPKLKEAASACPHGLGSTPGSSRCWAQDDARSPVGHKPMDPQSPSGPGPWDSTVPVGELRDACPSAPCPTSGHRGAELQDPSPLGRVREEPCKGRLFVFCFFLSKFLLKACFAITSVRN